MELEPIKIRRNSIAASSIMIGFYLTQAEITTSKGVSLLGVNFKIGNPDILIFAAWALTIFLFIRAWHKRDGKRRKGYRNLLFQTLLTPKKNRHFAAIATTLTSDVAGDDIRFQPDKIRTTTWVYHVTAELPQAGAAGVLHEQALPWWFAFDMLVHRLRFWILNPYVMDLFLADILFYSAIVIALVSAW